MHPSITELLRAITPEACDRMRKKRRSGESGGHEGGVDEVDPSPWLMPWETELLEREEEVANEDIAEVMGFGTFCSSKRVRNDF
jgi:hypothetical protein